MILSSPRKATFLPSYAAAELGSSAAATGIGLVLAHSGWGGWAVALSLCISHIPLVMVAPILAPVLERFDLRRLTMLVTALIALLTGVVAVATSLSIGILITLVGLTALLECISAPALIIVYERHHTRHTRARSFAHMDTARLLGMWVGPALGGWAFDAVGLKVLLLSDALSFALLTLSLLLLPHVVDVEAKRSTRRSWWVQVRQAPALLLAHSDVRRSMSVLWTAIIFSSLYSVAVVIYSVDTLHLTGWQYGVLLQCFVAGRLVGAQLGGRLGVMNSGVLLGVGFLVAGVVHHPVVAGAAFALSGAANAMQIAALRLLIVAQVPEEVQPKALSTMGSVNATAMLIGFAVAGPAVGYLGGAIGLVVAGAGTAAISAAGAFAAR